MISQRDAPQIAQILADEIGVDKAILVLSRLSDEVPGNRSWRDTITLVLRNMKHLKKMRK